MGIKKILGTSLLAVAAVGALAACGKKKTTTKGDDSSKVTTAAPKKDFGTLNVSELAGNIRVSFNILAQELGYFEEEGVKVNTKAIGGVNALTAISEGQLDILNTGFIPDLSALVGGSDLVFFGGTAVEGGAIIANKSVASKYKDAEGKIDFTDLEDAKIGLQRNESSWVVARQYVLEHYPSVDLDVVETESDSHTHYFAEFTDVQQAVSSGAIDLGFLPYEYAFKAVENGLNVEILAKAGELIPNYVCCREVTSKTTYEAKYDAIVAYERARIRAWQYYENEANRSKVVEILAKHSGNDKDYVEQYLFGGATKLSADPNKNGILSYFTAVKNAGVFNSLDQTAVDALVLANHVDTKAYKTALDSLIAEDGTNEFYQQTLTLYNQYNS